MPEIRLSARDAMVRESVAESQSGKVVKEMASRKLFGTGSQRRTAWLDSWIASTELSGSDAQSRITRFKRSIAYPDLFGSDAQSRMACFERSIASPDLSALTLRAA